MLKNGAIVGRDVVRMRVKHHIIAYWDHPATPFGRGQGDIGRTLCGMHVALGFGRIGKWEIVSGGNWNVERDCAHCMRSLASRS